MSLIDCIELISIIKSYFDRVQQNIISCRQLIQRSIFLSKVLDEIECDPKKSSVLVSETMVELKAFLQRAEKLINRCTQRVRLKTLRNLWNADGDYTELEFLKDGFDDFTGRLSVGQIIDHEKRRADDLADTKLMIETSVQEILSSIAEGSQNTTSGIEEIKHDIEACKEGIKGMLKMFDHRNLKLDEIRNLDAYLQQLSQDADQKHVEIINRLQEIHGEGEAANKKLDQLLLIAIAMKEDSLTSSEQKLRDKSLESLKLSHADITSTDIVLGTGGFGDIFEARLKSTPVALKCARVRKLPQASLKNAFAELENEMLLMHGLQPSPYILSCFGFLLEGTDEGTNVMKIVLELAPYGEDNDYLIYNLY